MRTGCCSLAALSRICRSPLGLAPLPSPSGSATPSALPVTSPDVHRPRAATLRAAPAGRSAIALRLGLGRSPGSGPGSGSRFAFGSRSRSGSGSGFGSGYTGTRGGASVPGALVRRGLRQQATSKALALGCGLGLG